MVFINELPCYCKNKLTVDRQRTLRRIRQVLPVPGKSGGVWLRGFYFQPDDGLVLNHIQTGLRCPIGRYFTPRGALSTRPVQSTSSCITYPHSLFSCTEAQGEVGLEVVGPHLLYLVGSEVGGEAGNRVWSSNPAPSSRMHKPSHSWFGSSPANFFLSNVASSP